MSKCPNQNCNTYDDFEAVPASISGIQHHNYMLVQCVNCQTVVGVLEQNNNSDLIRQLADKLGSYSQIWCMDH